MVAHRLRTQGTLRIRRSSFETKTSKLSALDGYVVELPILCNQYGDVRVSSVKYHNCSTY